MDGRTQTQARIQEFSSGGGGVQPTEKKNWQKKKTNQTKKKKKKKQIKGEKEGASVLFWVSRIEI